MAHSEQSPRDDTNDMPRIPPEIIRMFTNLPNSFEERDEALRQDNPDMAREIFIAADRYAHRDMKQKRAFAAGALFMYGLLRYDKQRKYFETLLDTSTSGDDGGEDQPLST